TTRRASSKTPGPGSVLRTGSGGAWRIESPRRGRRGAPGSDLEAIRFAPGVPASILGIEADHGSGQSISLESEAQIVEVHRGSQPRELSEHAHGRHRLGAPAAAHEVSDAVPEVALVVVDVTAHDDDLGAQPRGTPRTAPLHLLPTPPR